MAVLNTRKNPVIFHLLFCATSEKLFIPCKPSASVQSVKACPFWPRGGWEITLV